MQETSSDKTIGRPQDLNGTLPSPIVKRAPPEALVDRKTHLARGIKADIIDGRGVRLTKNMSKVPERTCENVGREWRTVSSCADLRIRDPGNHRSFDAQDPTQHARLPRVQLGTHGLREPRVVKGVQNHWVKDSLKKL